MFVADLQGVPTGRDALATLFDPSGVRDVCVLRCWSLEDPVRASAQSVAMHKNVVTSGLRLG